MRPHPTAPRRPVSPARRARALPRLAVALLTLAALVAAPRAQVIDAGLLPKDSFAGTVDAPDDVDVLLLEALAESTLSFSLKATKPADLRASLTLIDLGDDSVVAQLDATKPKLALKLVVPNTGTYRLEIASADGSTGPYKLTYKEKLSKALTKLTLEAEVPADGELSGSFDALQGFELSGKLQRTPKKSPATPDAPVLTRPAGGELPFDSVSLKVNKKGDAFTLKKVALDATGAWDFRADNLGELGGLRAKLALKRAKTKKRKLEEQARVEELPAPVLDALPTLTSSPTLLVSGTGVTPFGQVQVEGGAAPVIVTADADGGFVATVSLKLNALQQLWVSQLLGGVQGLAATHELVHDATPPFLFVDFPTDGALLAGGTTHVSGRVGDLLSGFGGLDVTVNGVSAAVNVGVGSNGSFDLAGVSLQSGASTPLVVVATDALGNSTSVTTHVTFQQGSGAQLAALTGDDQLGTVSSALGAPLQVRLANASDAPLPGRPVSFQVVKSDGLLSAPGEGAPPAQTVTVLTDAQGLAGVAWTLGSDAGMGNNRVRVTAPGVPGTLHFSASALGGAAVRLAAGAGNDQTAQAGSTLPQPLGVWVSDGLNGVPGVNVTFTASDGGLLAVGAAAGATPVQQLVVSTDATGRAAARWALGEQAGTQRVEADFGGNPGAPVRFRARAVAPEFMSTRLTGVVYDNSGQGLGGVLCEVHFPDGSEASTTTDVTGRFEFADLPRAGQADLAVHGPTVSTVGGAAVNPSALGFPELHYALFVVEAAANSLRRPVLLPRLDPTIKQTYDGTQSLVLTRPELAGLRMLLDAGTEVHHPDGSLVTPSNPIQLSVNAVHVEDIPRPFVDGAAPPFAWTLQPAGTRFDPPLRLELPNLPGLPAGGVAYILSFDHDTNRFEMVANATVSADATTIRTDPGQGIVVSGWGGFCPPYPDDGDLCPSDDLDCLLPDELILIGDDAEEEEEEEVEPNSSGASSLAMGVASAPGASAFDAWSAFAHTGTLECVGSAQDCAAGLQAELAGSVSISALAAWSLAPEAASIKTFMGALHTSYTTLRGLQADAHALDIGIRFPLALADARLDDFAAAIDAFDPMALEAARQQVEDDHAALSALLASLAAGTGGTLPQLDALFDEAVAHADALQLALDGVDDLLLRSAALRDLLLLRGAQARSGTSAGSVDAVGGYLVPDIPQVGGALRRVEVILQAGELTLYGQSDFVQVIPMQGVNAGPIVLSETPPAQLVSLSAQLAGGVTLIDMLETPIAVETTGVFSDGSTPALSGVPDGLSYSTSNVAVLSVAADGTAVAHAPGPVLVSVAREGAVASFLVQVQPEAPATTVTGLVVDASSAPLNGATVTSSTGGSGLSGGDGLFALADEPADDATLDLEVELGMLTGVTLDVPIVPGGTTQAGVIVADVDSDGDGLSDWHETNLSGSDPALADTDGDGLDDGTEVLVVGSDPNLADTDGDEFDDALEHALGSDPLAADAPTTIVGTLTLEGGGAASAGTARLAGVDSELYSADADGAGAFAFDPFPASLSPVTVVASAPGGFVGSSGATLTVPDGDTDVGAILLELSLDPLYLGQKTKLGLRVADVASGDIDGDGRVDVVASAFENAVVVLLGRPGGGFERAADVPAQFGPRGLALADLDGDGLLDLAVVTSSPSEVDVFLGAGDGSFTFDGSYGVGLAASHLAVFDAGGGSALDLHVLSNDSNVYTLLGNGDGTFGAASTTAVSSGSRGFGAGFLNGDAFMDIVVTSNNANDLTVLLGDGQGSFAPVTSAQGTQGGALALGHFDGDDVLDLIVGSVFGGQTDVLLGNGDGSFTPHVDFSVGALSYAMVAVDLDDDGDDDVLASTGGTHDLKALICNGDGSFQAPVAWLTGRTPQGVLAADFDLDGNVDALTANLDSRDVSVLPGLGDGGFAAPAIVDGGASSGGGDLGDLDGDGELDLIVPRGTAAGTMVLLGDGAGSFGAPFTVGLPSSSSFTRLGQFSGDSVLDLISFRPNTDKVELRGGLGNGDFAQGEDIHTSNFLWDAALGELDGDDVTDLVVANRGAGTVTVLLGDGALGVASSVDLAAGTSPAAVRLGDLDGDGDLDLVVSDVFEDDLMVFLNDGAGAFSPASVPEFDVADRAEELALGDFTGDGVLDIVAGVAPEDMLYLIAGNGDGTFAAPVELFELLDPEDVECADVNADGAVDILLVIPGHDELLIALGDGAGGVLEMLSYHAGRRPIDVLVTELDGDGTPDLVLLNEPGEGALVLLHQ